MSPEKTAIKDWLSLVKFSHTVFAMPFALIGFALAVSDPAFDFSLKLLVLIILCMVFARNSAMGFNRLADRKFDKLNPRTSDREIPAGKISSKPAAWFVIINSALFIAAAGLINKLTLVLAPVALIIILGYSLTKRFTALCHFILGLGLSLAPVGAYISVTGKFELIAVIYSFIVLTWVSGFDIIYALQDESFDKSNNLKSVPSSIGIKKALLLSSAIHILTAAAVVTAGLAAKSGILFWSGSAVFVSLLLYQHLIVKPSDLSRVNIAFGTTNGIASVIFAVAVILDLILRN